MQNKGIYVSNINTFSVEKSYFKLRKAKNISMIIQFILNTFVSLNHVNNESWCLPLEGLLLLLFLLFTCASPPPTVERDSVQKCQRGANLAKLLISPPLSIF